MSVLVLFCDNTEGLGTDCDDLVLAAVQTQNKMAVVTWKGVSCSLGLPEVTEHLLVSVRAGFSLFLFNPKCIGI